MGVTGGTPLGFDVGEGEGLLFTHALNAPVYAHHINPHTVLGGKYIFLLPLKLND
jgi:hypothetical protein